MWSALSYLVSPYRVTLSINVTCQDGGHTVVIMVVIAFWHTMPLKLNATSGCPRP